MPLQKSAVRQHSMKTSTIRQDIGVSAECILGSRCYIPGWTVTSNFACEKPDPLLRIHQASQRRCAVAWQSLLPMFYQHLVSLCLVALDFEECGSQHAVLIDLMDTMDKKELHQLEKRHFHLLLDQKQVSREGLTACQLCHGLIRHSNKIE